MRNELVKLLRETTPAVQQGTVVTADVNTVTIVSGGRTRTVPRLTALALKPGDRLNLQGDSIVGRRRPPPTGATYQV